MSTDVRYYLCPICKIAYSKFGALNLHWRGKHPNEQWPDLTGENATRFSSVDLPNGYTYREPGPKRKLKRLMNVNNNGSDNENLNEPEHMDDNELPQPSPQPPTPKPMSVDDLPDDFFERLDISLSVHKLPSQIKEHVIGVFRLHPEAVDNPNNFASLLTSILSSSQSGRSHLPKVSIITLEAFGPMNMGMNNINAGMNQQYFGGMPQNNPYGNYNPMSPQMNPMNPNSPMHQYIPGYPITPGYPPINDHFHPHEFVDRRRSNDDDDGDNTDNRNTNESKKYRELQQKYTELQTQNAETQSKIDTLLDEFKKQAEIEREEKRKREIEDIELKHENELEKLRLEQKENLASVQSQFTELITGLQHQLEKSSAQKDDPVKLLAEELRSLKDEISNSRLADLQSEIQTLKSAPRTGMTELDVISRAADKAIDTINKAGSDVKSVMLSQRVASNFPPGRRSPEERSSLGDNIVKTIETREEVDKRGKVLFGGP